VKQGDWYQLHITAFLETFTYYYYCTTIYFIRSVKARLKPTGSFQNVDTFCVIRRNECLVLFCAGDNSLVGKPVDGYR
jgi:hypothetical protein